VMGVGFRGWNYPWLQLHTLLLRMCIAHSHVARSVPYQASTLSAGVKSLVSSHVSSQQSSYFSGSQQQPLFLTTFDMPLEAPPPPGLRPFYGHPWLWPQPQGSGPSTDCSRPQHGDTAPGQQLAALGQQSLTMTWPS
jgi:hypothetical protein